MERKPTRSLEALPSDSAWGSLLRKVALQWPEHIDFVARAAQTASDDVRETAQRSSTLIARLIGEDWANSIAGYRWMCEMVLEEELGFRRSGSYRFSRFDEVRKLVYDDAALMGKYMSGLLVSQAVWPNHLALCDFYVRRFLSQLEPSSQHLEVGPGHGLLLFLAAERRPARIAGWDVSATSLRKTDACLRALGITGSVTLEQRDISAPVWPSDESRFDSVVASELLEHLEQPGDALRSLRRVLRPGGRLFVNVPVNSPTIDHIYLFRTPEELVALVESVGFQIIDTCVAPASGYPEARARKQALPMSVGIVAQA